MSDYSPRFLLKNQLRQSARERFWSEYDKDEYACPACKRTDVPFEVHHRDSDTFNNHLLNLIAVCVRCHKQHHKRQYRHESLESWKDSLSDVVND